jgi:hypothetical protein
VSKYSERNGIKDLGFRKQQGKTRYNNAKEKEAENRVKHYNVIVDPEVI